VKTQIETQRNESGGAQILEYGNGTTVRVEL
jgi:hypothetical protein